MLKIIVSFHVNEHVHFSNTITGIQTTSNMSFCLKNGRFTKSIPQKKAINLKNQGVHDKESDDIAPENCGESSFQEALSWRDE